MRNALRKGEAALDALAVEDACEPVLVVGPHLLVRNRRRREPSGRHLFGLGRLARAIAEPHDVEVHAHELGRAAVGEMIALRGRGGR